MRRCQLTCNEIDQIGGMFPVDFQNPARTSFFQGQFNAWSLDIGHPHLCVLKGYNFIAYCIHANSRKYDGVHLNFAFLAHLHLMHLTHLHISSLNLEIYISQFIVHLNLEFYICALKVPIKKCVHLHTHFFWNLDIYISFTIWAFEVPTISNIFSPTSTFHSSHHVCHCCHPTYAHPVQVLPI